MADINISLSAPMQGWVEARVDSGKYENPSEYISDLIRHDQQRQAKINVIQQAIDEGIESGIAEDFEPDAFEQKMLKKYKNA